MQLKASKKMKSEWFFYKMPSIACLEGIFSFETIGLGNIVNGCGTGKIKTEIKLFISLKTT